MKQDTITIVSGLPRSGTSLMMQMLVAGGLPALTDGTRQPDENNPKGYFELEAVKHTREDASWLNETNGKCVKVVSILLYDLPRDRRYNIIFMTRNMEEILASQAAMLRVRNVHDTSKDEDMRRCFEAHLLKLERRLAEQENVTVFYCDYNELIRMPEHQAIKIRDFLDINLNTQAMMAVVDPKLHRQKK
ncbi:MAG: sulfotransferase domain-containing protein [bacterium]